MFGVPRLRGRVSGLPPEGGTPNLLCSEVLLEDAGKERRGNRAR